MSDYVLPDQFPPIWASDWGEDECGLWIAFTYKGIRQAFRWIPPGRFMMGSPDSELERDNDELQHEVTLSKGYWLAETTCTQALWEAVMDNNPSEFKGSERPAENISWNDAQQFMQTLNDEQEELGLRFPTEAEWEHACRAETQTPFNFGENITTDQVNINGNHPYADAEKGQYRAETVEVTALPKNSWGFYQMHGNVREWCADWFGNYPAEAVTDPIGPKTGDSRVLRGGSWISLGRRVRSAYRSMRDPSNRNGSIGFRLARGPKGEPAGE
ncbi:MAG: formylglycine-generating enzyme family protein [Methylococcales bacterium]